jgi:hypothetical protein
VFYFIGWVTSSLYSRQSYSLYTASEGYNLSIYNGTMSADIFQCKMTHAILLKWIFLALKWPVFNLKIVSNFSKKTTPANSKQNLNIMQL